MLGEIREMDKYMAVLISLCLKENGLMCLYDYTCDQLIKNMHVNMINDFLSLTMKSVRKTN